MKRWMLISLLGLPLALCSNTALYAQHGHGGAGLGPGGAGAPGLSPSGAPGRSGANDAGNRSINSSGNTGSSHGSSSVMTSKDPGGVLDHNSQLATKLENLIGPGTSLATLKMYADTFRNFGQFVAAVHVANNLDIPFTTLQAKVTGQNAVSLGKAIQELKPAANSKNEVKKATTQANEDAKDANS
jgi:hypothetical protein